MAMARGLRSPLLVTCCLLALNSLVVLWCTLLIHVNRAVKVSQGGSLGVRPCTLTALGTSPHAPTTPTTLGMRFSALTTLGVRPHAPTALTTLGRRPHTQGSHGTRPRTQVDQGARPRTQGSQATRPHTQGSQDTRLHTQGSQGARPCIHAV